MTLLAAVLWVVAAAWAMALLQLIVNRLLIPDLARGKPADVAEWPRVSIVVPARDEEAGVEAAVGSFCTQDYPALEVIVVDDRSRDRTGEILLRLQGSFPNLTVVSGEEPPDGWLGKPWALETGWRRARGEWLLFVDADVVFAPSLVRRAIAYAIRERAGMVALAPRIVTEGVVEAAIMSQLALVAGAIYPMFLVSRTRVGGLAVGSGVGNLVHRRALRDCDAFSCLRREIVDDIGLGIRVKRAGARVCVAGAVDLIRVRMYPGAAATVRGFTKNAYPGLAGRFGPAGVLLIMAMGLVFSLLPTLCLALGLVVGAPILLPAALGVVLGTLTAAGVALFFRMPWTVAFSGPIREIGWWVILVRSFLQYRRAGVVWRGRSYPRRGGDAGGA